MKRLLSSKNLLFIMGFIIACAYAPLNKAATAAEAPAGATTAAVAETAKSADATDVATTFDTAEVAKPAEAKPKPVAKAKAADDKKQPPKPIVPGALEALPDLPGGAKQADIAVGGAQPLLVAVNTQNQAFQLSADWKSWNKIGDNIIQVSIGCDGDIWGLDASGKAVHFTDKGVVTIPTNAQKISVGNKNEVWVVATGSNEPWRKKDPQHDTKNWGGPFVNGGKGRYLSCGGDGVTLLVDDDGRIKKFDRYDEQWKEVIRPAQFQMGAPVKVELKDEFNVVFLSSSSQGYQLIPGRDGSKRDDWQGLPDSPKITHIAAGHDGTLLVIKDNKILVRKPVAEETARLEEARGFIVHTGQMGKLVAAHWGQKRIWTHASSLYDPNGTKPSPQDHFELLVGDPTMLPDAEVIFGGFGHGYFKPETMVPGPAGTGEHWANFTSPLNSMLQEKRTLPIRFRDQASQPPFFNPAGKKGKDLYLAIRFQQGDLAAIRVNEYEMITSVAGWPPIETRVKDKFPPLPSRQDHGSFFSFLVPKNPDATDPLQYGDSVEIISLYAAEFIAPALLPAASYPYPNLDNKEKAGPTGKNRKWWVNEAHIQWKAPFGEVLVSAGDLPGVKDGRQLFRVVSPSGKTGVVRSNDTIEIESLAPTAQGEKVWVHGLYNRILPTMPVRVKPKGELWHELRSKNQQWADNVNDQLLPMIKPLDNRAGEILIKDKAAEANANFPFGYRPLSGAQMFKFQVFNTENDLSTDIEKDALGNSPRDVFNVLAKGFWRPADVVEAEKKSELRAQMTAGIAQLKIVRNETDYPLDLKDLAVVKSEDSFIAPEGKSRILDTPLKITGHVLDGEVDFGPDKMIQLKKMFSKGYVWIEESLKEASQVTITFMARAKDQGGIEVDFGTSDADIDSNVKVIIGGVNNTKSQILFRDSDEKTFRLIAETEAKNNPLSKVQPGKFIAYWVTIYDGFVMAGLDKPGENIFLSGLLPTNLELIHYGFSSHNGPVDYGEIKTAPTLIPLADQTVYAQSDKDIDLPANQKGATQWLGLPMRLENEGAVSFNVLGKDTATVLLQNDKGDNYKIIFGDEGNKYVRIFRKGKQALELNIMAMPSAQLSPTEARRFWVSIQGGLIIVGQGDIGNNALLAWQDLDQITNVTKVGFAPASNAQKISAIKVGPPVIFGDEKAEPLYKQVIKRFDYRGLMKVIRPLDYELVQLDQGVILRNNLPGGRIYTVLGTPQQKGEYEFRATVDKSGLPFFELTHAPEEAKEKIELDRDAMLKEVEADYKVNMSYAESMVLDATAAQLQMAAGSFGSSFNQTAMGVGIGFAIGGVAAGAAAAGIKQKGAQDAAKLRSAAGQERVQANFAFRALDKYVLTDAVDPSQFAQSSVPDDALVNMQVIQGTLAGIDQQQLDFANPDSYKKLMGFYQDIINRVNHPAVLQDQALKKRIYADLERFIRNATQGQSVYEDLIGLLVSANTNPYLVNQEEKTDVAAKNRWYNTVVELGDALLNYALQNPGVEITIPPLYGQYLWFAGELQEGRGALIFTARGQNDLNFCFAQEVTQVRNTDNQIYEVVFGAYNNTRTDIRIKSLGRAAASTKDKNSLLADIRTRDYWINFDNGTIQLGSGKVLGEKEFLKWQDPYPWNDIKFVGIGSWDVPIKISALQTSFSPAVQAADQAAAAEAPADQAPADQAPAEAVPEEQQVQEAAPAA